ncbi:type IV pilus biogenesis/stability protein PilW [Halomonas caseinilytica]|uniref:Type IV pilus assembly protein PilF n=1 Tax=Halomonas caseinilytica TaxID=438744 RepID=A0A1M6VIP7_9GAMM|nr:type IV pilus biogenesis/stability protein PilW [Halomonas caseinilytica]SEN04794.1 type IV pilus assembly protein PilF [Halomonas caseinilytica]SHK81340.1 type IV pilus assembly protein PilF [Halomonas caseinilytica]
MTGRPSLDGYRQCRIAVLLIGALWLSGCAMRDDQAPRDADPVEAYTRLGEAYLARDDLQRASEALGHALELAPGDAEARQAMAMVHQRRGDDALAEENFRAALHDDPDLTRARNNYAAFLYDRGRIREACHQLQRASKDTRYINRGQLLVNLGRCQRATGDEAAARASFEQALRIDPGRPGAHLRLAELDIAQGRFENAERHLERYRRQAGPDAASARLADDIARARGDHDRPATSRGTP